MSLITRPGRATNRPKNPKDNRTRFAANGICKSSSMAAFFKHFDFAFTAGNEQSAANAETVPRYKLARQAMLVIKRFRGRTLRIRNVAKECQLSRKVGYKMTRARKKI